MQPTIHQSLDAHRRLRDITPTCRMCGAPLVGRNRGTKWCSLACKERHRDANPTPARRASWEAARARFRAANPDYHKEYAAKNRAAISERRKEYRDAHRADVRAAKAKRRAAELLRTPAWADLSAIREVYRSATVAGLTVDHIVPLQGRLVSGLHVAWNLRALSAKENSAKCNRWDPEVDSEKWGIPLTQAQPSNRPSH